jgi:predicted MFS family arabinose efflux permease
MVGIWNASIPIGSAIGVALGGFIAVKYGWRHAFGIVALPGLIIAFLFFFTKDYKTVDLVRSVKEKKDDSGIQRKMSRKDIIKEFTGTPSLIFTYFAFAGNTFLTTAMLSWLPTYFNRVENMPMQQASLKGSSIMLLAIIGSPLGGFLADTWMKKRTNARLLFSALSSVTTSVVFFSAFYFLTGPFQYYLLLFGGVCAIAFASSAIAVTQDVVHPGLRATSYSLCVIVQNLLGSSLGPLFVGALSDKYDIKTALTVASLSSLVAGILFFIGSFYYEKDLAKVEKITITVE